MSGHRSGDYGSPSYELDMSEARKVVRRMLAEREPAALVVERARELYREAHLKEKERIEDQERDDRADRAWLALKYGRAQGGRYHVVHASP